MIEKEIEDLQKFIDESAFGIFTVLRGQRYAKARALHRDWVNKLKDKINDLESKTKEKTSGTSGNP